MQGSGVDALEEMAGLSWLWVGAGQLWQADWSSGRGAVVKRVPR